MPCYYYQTGFRTKRRWWGQIEERMSNPGLGSYSGSTRFRAWTAKGLAQKIARWLNERGYGSVALHENSRRPRWHTFGPEWHNPEGCEHTRAA